MSGAMAIGAGYNPAAWYWQIGSNTAQVYSSAAAALVPVTDAGYVGFLARGCLPTAIPNMGALQQVLAAQYPAGLPGGQVAALMAAGCAVVSTATPALNATYPLDVEHLFYITSVAAGLAEGRGLPNGLATVGISDLGGGIHQMAAADFLNLAIALRDYFAALKATSAVLLGGGTAAWPAQPVTIA
ncbi:MAG: hypothetical protein ACRYHQ_24255 [Janthinobacterium lividum]